MDRSGAWLPKKEENRQPKGAPPQILLPSVERKKTDRPREGWKRKKENREPKGGMGGALALGALGVQSVTSSTWRNLDFFFS